MVPFGTSDCCEEHGVGFQSGLFHFFCDGFSVRIDAATADELLPEVELSVLVLKDL
jgi:hypothetical protein